MKDLTRRTFCATTALAIPFLRTQGMSMDMLNQPIDSTAVDPIMDMLSKEFFRITSNGAENGFRGEHLRRYAGMIRTLDAYMESRGINKEGDRRLDDDDFKKLNPFFLAQSSAQYWKKYNVSLDEKALVQRMKMDESVYREVKRNIKNMGGLSKFNAGIAAYIEKRSSEFEEASFKGNVLFKEGKVIIASPPAESAAKIIDAQLSTGDFSFGLPDLSVLITSNIHCVCKAIQVEIAVLTLMCAFTFGTTCVPAAMLTALELFLELYFGCDPRRC